MQRNQLITGGAGFIGANYVHYLLERTGDRVVVFDKLTYAGNLASLENVAGNSRFTFIHADICDADAVEVALAENNIDIIVNFAAETHVDRSIDSSDAFIQTDVVGTHVLLEAATRRQLRYHQVSTDEVYGHVGQGASRESDPVAPRSPYAASKAAGDLLVNAFHTTYGLHTTITRGANNVGPYQYPEKVVSLFATNAIDDEALPVYGDGLQQRDYQWVGDHCAAIALVVDRGAPGDVYNVGTGKSITNMRMVEIVLETLGKSGDLVRHVEDRPGHDRRYALDVAKIRSLGWAPQYTPEESIAMAALWYRDNEPWWRPIKAGEFREYYDRMYGRRAVLG